MSLEDIIVETPFGRLRGSQEDGIACFKRVPYSLPPIGDRRFEMPSPPPRWTAVLEATRQGPVPPQLPSRLDAVMGTFSAIQNEDCLHLDIWTPYSKGERAPVLVFIHGGAFMTGGGSLPCYGGHELAKLGLVVVTITYRLGIFGFMPIPEFGATNLGLHDQVAALRWIREAIGSFGGDPARITVAGQSAGAFSVAAFLTNGLGPALFDRAVMMSAPIGLKLKKTEAATDTRAALVQALGMSENDTGKLRELPVDQLMEAQSKLRLPPPAEAGDVTPPFMPVIDGDIIPDDPLVLVEQSAAAWCETIIGVTREEHAAFTISNPAIDAMTEDELRGIFVRSYGADADEALGRARAKRAPATPRALICDIKSDKTFVDASLSFADIQTKRGQNTFVYRFDWQSPMSGLWACHCIDLPFLFGNMDVWSSSPMIAGADPREVRELSSIFQRAIAAFATNGSTNGPGLPRWPSHDHSRAVLHFDRQINTFGWQT